MRNATWRPFSGCFSSLQELVAEDMRRRISALLFDSWICQDRYTWNPLMTPCFDWKFGLVLGGLGPFQNRGHQRVPGIYIYIYLPYTFGSHLWGSGIGWIPARNVQSCLALRSMPPMLLAGGEGFRGNYFLMVSNIFCFHPKPWGNDPI